MMEQREEQILQLLNKIGVKPNDISRYSTALTHRSYINENRGHQSGHNERLEFLGDAVLELVISEYLYDRFPDRPEGELTSFRAAAVKTESLADTAKELELGQLLIMSKGEMATGGQEKGYLLANAFEAFLGALYIDQDYQACKKFLLDIFESKIEEIVDKRLDIDAKTKFQEIAQSMFKQTPTYSLIQEDGPDHEKIFTMGVFIGEKQFGMGKGQSKQKAEEKAARQALKKVEKMKSSANFA